MSRCADSVPPMPRSYKPEDKHLLTSLHTLKAQRKAASDPEEQLADRESLGFSAPARRRPGFPSREFKDGELEEY